MKLPSFFEKTLSFLQAEPSIYGLDISDAVLRLAYFDGSSWKLLSERLAPGVLEGGQVKNKSEFLNSLLRLRGQLSPREKDRKTSVVVVMSSLHIYSQVFSLPLVKGANLDQAVALNLQMLSPIESSQTYAGWQIVGEEKNSRKIEILSAFIPRASADAVNSVLEEAGFLIVVFEPRALSLLRLVRDEGAGVDSTKAYLIANVDDNGIDLLVARHGELYFQYFNPWRELHEGRFMSIPVFENIVVRSFAQVINFSGQHWSEPVKDVYLFAIGLSDRVADVVKRNFPLTVQELKLKNDQAVDPSCFIVAGAALRGLVPRRKDTALNLLGIEVQEKFRRQSLLNFVKFWRVMMPLALGLLIAVFVGSEIFIRNVEKEVSAQAITDSGGGRANEFASLQEEAKKFNASVAMIKSVRLTSFPNGPILDKIFGLAATTDIAITRFPFNGCGALTTLNGKALSQDKILDFKQAMEKDPSIGNFSLPLTSIQQGSDGRYSFLINFTITCPASS